MSLWTGIAIGSLATLALSKIVGYAKNGEQLVVEPKFRIHKIGIDFIEFAFDTTIKNPTHSAFKIDYPFIKVMLGDTVIASSNLVNKQVSFPPMSEYSIKDLRLKVPFISLGSFASEYLSNLVQGKGKTKVSVEVSSYIYTDLANVPYNKKFDFEL